MALSINPESTILKDIDTLKRHLGSRRGMQTEGRALWMTIDDSIEDESEQFQLTGSSLGEIRLETGKL